jgi:pimeloyl-ACP methyl ester carboxylesterase
VGGYVDIGAHPTWVDERGRGVETVLLLHGGLSNSDDLLDTIGAPLAERYRVVAFDRRGHGRTADTPDAFHYDDMATEAIGVLERVVGDRAHLVGYSDGAIVALLVAMQQPDRAAKIVLIGGNYHHEGISLPSFDAGSSLVAELAERYGQRSPDGPDHFTAVVDKSVAMWSSEPTLTTDDLRQVDLPALVIAGDDELVALDHTWSLYASLGAGQLAVVPGSSHALPIEKPADVARLVLEFLGAEGSPQTLMPVRRRTDPRRASLDSPG